MTHKNPIGGGLERHKCDNPPPLPHPASGGGVGRTIDKCIKRFAERIFAIQGNRIVLYTRKKFRVFLFTVSDQFPRKANIMHLENLAHYDVYSHLITAIQNGGISLKY